MPVAIFTDCYRLKQKALQNKEDTADTTEPLQTMDEIEDQELIFYRQGCERLGWTPLEADDFWSKYRQYLRCHRFLQAWETHRASSSGPLFLAQSFVLAPTLRRLLRELDGLGFLGSAVAAGRSGPDGTNGSAAPVPRTPVPRTGADAASLF